MAGIIEVKDQGKLRIYDADNSHYIDIVVPSSVTANRTITIPDASFTVPQVTNATHSGEVTGATALTIADNIVDEANLKVSNSAVNGYMLTAQSGNTGGLTWAAAPSGGLSGADFWRLNQDSQFGAGTQVLNGNWERVDTDGFGYIGTAMSQSSGIFSFPSTGMWLITFQVSAYRPSNSLQFTSFKIQTTLNNSSYDVASAVTVSTPSNSDYRSGGVTSFIFDVTNTSNCKIRTLYTELQGNASDLNCFGDTASTETGISFIKLGDT